MGVEMGLMGVPKSRLTPMRYRFHTWPVSEVTLRPNVPVSEILKLRVNVLLRTILWVVKR